MHRKWAALQRVVLLIVFSVAAFTIYNDAVARAERGAFPLSDTPMFVMLVLWWWATPLEALFRGERLQNLGLAQNPMLEAEAPVNGIKKGLLWSAGTLIGWLWLTLRANAAAGVASREPSAESLRQYEMRSLEIFAFVLIWILAFPIIPKLPVKRWVTLATLLIVILAVIGFAAGWSQQLVRAEALPASARFQQLQKVLLRAAMLAYVLIVVRRFLLPGLICRLSARAVVTGQSATA